jgi:hypothetical protein
MGELSAKRKEALGVLAVVPQGQGIRSDLEPDKFHDLTGYWHKDMKQSWRENMKGPKLLTACGGFASYFAGRMKITGLASFFDLEKSLIDADKAHAWVPASSGAKPQPGDILRHTVYHVDVAAGWDGGKLKRVAAGQSLHPRPTTNVEGEFDCLKWVTGTGNYNAANLQGWLDLDLYFGAAPAPGPALGWLTGWWKVWDGNTYHYCFSPGGIVQYTKAPPKGSGPPKHPANIGRFTFTPPAELVITWNKIAGAPSACEETFYNAAPGCRQMNATSTLYGPLVGTRL